MITGASSGIGREFARQLARKGYSLILVARRGKRLEKLAQELVKYGCQTEIIAADLSQPKECVRVMKETKEFPIKIFINNAGFGACGDFTDTDAATELQMIDVNVKGVLTGTKAVLSDMIARNEGTIINIRSIAGRKTFDNHSVYCGTKYAVHAMTESMRREASGSNVRMIVIAPGVVETPLRSHTSNQEIKDNYNLWKQEIDGGLEPSQIADCAWFAYQMPQEVCVREIVIAKTKQAD